jgi:hypothetical protein
VDSNERCCVAACDDAECSVATGGSLLLTTPSSQGRRTNIVTKRQQYEQENTTPTRKNRPKDVANGREHDAYLKENINT